MLEYNTDEFNPRKYPLTNAKLASFTKRIDEVYKFIKNSFVIQKKELNMKATDLFDKFWEHHDMKKYPRADLKKKLEDVGINYFKTNGNFVYRYSFEQLNEIAAKYHWLDEFDNEAMDEVEEEEEPTKNNYFNELNIKHNELNSKYDELKKILEEKEKEIDNLKILLEAKPNQKRKPKKVQIVIEPEITLYPKVDEEDIFMSLLQTP
jgi:hypothetical protein